MLLKLLCFTFINQSVINASISLKPIAKNMLHLSYCNSIVCWGQFHHKEDSGLGLYLTFELSRGRERRKGGWVVSGGGVEGWDLIH